MNRNQQPTKLYPQTIAEGLITDVVIKATLAAPLSHPQYQKNSDTGDQMLKKPLQQPPYPLPLFLHGLKLPLNPLYKWNLSSTPYQWDPLYFPSYLHTATDARFGGGEEKMMWHCGTHELGRKIGKPLEQVVF
jgi:hypothetical protein